VAAEEPAREGAVLVETDVGLDAALERARAAFSPQDSVSVLHWRQAIPQIIELIEMDRQFSTMLWFIIGLMVAFAVLNTVLMGVLERTREFGVMMALGLSPWRLARLVVVEAFLMGVLGAFAAGILGIIATYPLVRWGWDLTAYMGEAAAFEGVPVETHIFAIYDWERMAIYAFFGVLFTVAASIWPAWMVVRLEPVQAMRPQ